MRRLGTIVRIQIQVDRLKTGDEPRRVYDPGGIRSVESVWVGRDGVVAPVEAGYVLDVHHQAHPHTRNREGGNGLSLGFTGHYDLMRARFGERVELWGWQGRISSSIEQTWCLLRSWRAGW